MAIGLAMPARIHAAVPSISGPARISRRSRTQPDGRPLDTSRRRTSAQQLDKALRAPGTHLVDVRTPAEFESVRIAGAVNVPLDRLDATALLVRIGAHTPVYCVCQTGTRSQLAAAALRSGGFTRVVHVDGGTNAWAMAGLPLERGTPVRA